MRVRAAPRGLPLNIALTLARNPTQTLTPNPNANPNPNLFRPGLSRVPGLAHHCLVAFFSDLSQRKSIGTVYAGPRLVRDRVMGWK